MFNAATICITTCVHFIYNIPHISCIVLHSMLLIVNRQAPYPIIFILSLQFTGVQSLWNDHSLLYECHLCSFNSKYGKSIYRHIEIQHGVPRKTKCPMCLKMWSRRDHLKNHLKTVHKVDPSLFNFWWMWILWTQIWGSRLPQLWTELDAHIFDNAIVIIVFTVVFSRLVIWLRYIYT